MENSDNYYIEHRSANRRDGSILKNKHGGTYDAQGTALRDVEDFYPELKEDNEKFRKKQEKENNGSGNDNPCPDK